MKIAILINSSGKNEKLACFKRPESTDAKDSCPLVWQNQVYVFGGSNEKRQISKLIDHSLKRIGNLTFYHTGACSRLDYPQTSYIMLCFHFRATKDNYNRCHRSNGPREPFYEVARSNHMHRSTQTSSFKSKQVFFSKQLLVQCK